MSNGEVHRRVPTARTIVRRRNIIGIIRRYRVETGYGPRTSDIARALGYRGHSLRSNHLEQMEARGQIAWVDGEGWTAL
jgi:SOS-response transcriptional repressor LexA